MFSPEASIVGARSSLRNPRRRPRNSDGAQQHQQPRRKRSKLGDETFVPVEDAHTNGNGSALMNGHAGNGSADSSLVMVEMPVREKKPPAKRAPKDETSQYLTRHESYNVKKLPSFPNALAAGSVPYRASASSSSGLALALTSTQALVWDYNSPGGPTKILALPLPPAIQGAEPLPLGAIVRNGPSNDFGVVAVAPSTGKIVFWENADSAEARSHFPQRHQGVEGSVRLYSGEHITDLVDIEHAGYILVFSSGRLAQLTLRDTQGRPNIHAAVLSPPTGSSGSFFGLKSLLGGAIRKTIASVKARPSESKGQMEVITATKSGLFHLWDLTWSGQHTFKREIDVRANVLSAMQQGTPPETRGQQDVHLLDFAIMEPRLTSANVGLLTLVALSGRSMMDYFLLELDLSENGGTVSRAIPLRNFHQPELPKEPVGTLLLPGPGHSALIQFPTGIVIASLVEPEESPETQLFADSGRSILPFQDCVYFRADANVCIVGHALEQSSRKDKIASALLFVQDYGILRVSAIGLEPDDQKQRKVTVSSKLLQATFFSTIPGNILDFSTKSRFSFKQEDVEAAAIRISVGVLSSSFSQFERVTASMDDQLRKRAAALKTLITHLRSENLPIGFAVKWQLLWYAEKLAAAQQLWKWYQAKLHDQQLHPEAYPEKILMGDIILALLEKYKTALDLEKGETDPIRQFFISDVDSLGKLIPWGWYHLRLFYLQSDTAQPASITQRLSEANDVFIVTLEAALSFRNANIERYGLDPDTLEDGILKPGCGYDLMSQQPWTSTHNLVSSIRSIIDVGRVHAVEGFEEGGNPELFKKIAEDNPRLVKLGCQTHIERFQWALEQSEEKQRETGKNLWEEWDQKVRPAHIYGLMEIGLPTEGMALAEQYEDMTTLANLLWDETEWLQVQRIESQSKMEQAQSKVKLDRIKERTAAYFDRYGAKWAEAYFNKHIVENKSGQLLENAALYQGWLTGFLQSDIKYARLCWINDVVAEDDFETAALALYTTAERQESNAWCSKVELSIAKLALLCRDENKPETPEGEDKPPKHPALVMNEEKEAVRARIYRNIDDRLEYAKLQELLYEHRILPIITSALDENVALETLMETFGKERLAERPALQQLLRQGFDDLMHHRVVDPCLMIDVLTLMTNPADEPNTLDGHEFVFALQTLTLNWDDIQRTTRIGLRGLIWKRLIIQDDWERINDTEGLSDAELNAFLLQTNTGSTLKTIVRMAREDAAYRHIMLPPVDELWGSGCTDGELCIRFAAEDLRKPIMRDNALDEAIFKTHMEKHRLEAWLKATTRAAVQEDQREVEAAAEAVAEASAPETQTVEVAESAVTESIELAEEAAEENFEGDDEESAAERDGDVEMAYS